MTTARPTSSHPSTGELLRQLDGELGNEAMGRLQRHLRRCESCRRRAAELGECSSDTSRYLERLPSGAEEGEGARDGVFAAMREADAQRRTMVSARRGWAIAALIAGLVVISLGVDPLRAWVLDRMPRLIPAAERVVTPAVSVPAAVVDGEGSVIVFQPIGTKFELRVEQPQDDGELFLQVRSVGRATAQITNADAETVLVLPSGLRIENALSSTASYRVTLPTTVTEVVLRIGDEAPRILAIPAGSESWSETIPLRIQE